MTHPARWPMVTAHQPAPFAIGSVENGQKRP
jgi:hypothetical protein